MDILQQQDIDDLFRRSPDGEAFPDRRAHGAEHDDDVQMYTEPHHDTRPVMEARPVAAQPSAMRKVGTRMRKTAPNASLQEALHMALSIFQGKSSRKVPLREHIAPRPAKRARPYIPEEATPVQQPSYIDTLRSALHSTACTGIADWLRLFNSCVAHWLRQAQGEHSGSRRHCNTCQCSQRTIQPRLHTPPGQCSAACTQRCSLAAACTAPRAG